MTQDFSEQLADLQSQLAFQEDAIQQLSDALYNQQQRMDKMEHQIGHLKDELEKTREAQPSSLSQNEKPPHY